MTNDNDKPDDNNSKPILDVKRKPYMISWPQALGENRNVYRTKEYLSKRNKYMTKRKSEDAERRNSATS